MELSSLRHYQIVDASDFRFPGGTSHSIAAEVRAQADAGISTAIAHIDSPVHKRAHPWSRPIQDLLSDRKADLLSPTETVTADLLVIRHPAVVSEGFFPYGLKVAKVIVLANHVPEDADGSVNYDVLLANQLLRDRFATDPLWYPIGPVVREGLTKYAEKIALSREDWTNTLSVLPLPMLERDAPGARPTIGRHSRAQASKWPATAKEIRSAYPMDTEFDVRILGGAEPAKKILGKVPANWTVHNFGSVTPSVFLKDLDFWVYFHHPHLREAFGRAIMEALLAGCVVILPEYLRPSYGDAALYGTPSDVRPIVRALSNDPDAFQAQSRRGQEFVRRFGPETHIERLSTMGIVGSVQSSPRAHAIAPSLTKSKHGRPKVMFITSNGAGMGHLTRLLAVAREGRDRFDSVFVSLSAAVPVVMDYGFHFEYIMSSGAMGVGYKPWNRYFAARLRELIDVYRPDGLVFDGTVPYGGLLAVLPEFDGVRVWMRRGMWKESANSTPLARAEQFDLVIEPGDFASAYDRGPTRGILEPVEPIVLVSESETLDRGAARAELGIEDSERAALVTLGAGTINSIDEAQAASIEAFNGAGWRVFVTKPPIARTGDSGGQGDYEILQTYPLARLARGFDAVVSACGYNSYHEWLANGVPTIWIPNTATSVDDQSARARFASDSGLSIAVMEGKPDEVVRAVETLTDVASRQKLVTKMEPFRHPIGATQSADLIVEALSRRMGAR